MTSLYLLELVDCFNRHDVMWSTGQLYGDISDWFYCEFDKPKYVKASSAPLAYYINNAFSCVVGVMFYLPLLTRLLYQLVETGNCIEVEGIISPSSLLSAAHLLENILIALNKVSETQPDSVTKVASEFIYFLYLWYCFVSAVRLGLVLNLLLIKLFLHLNITVPSLSLSPLFPSSLPS